MTTTADLAFLDRENFALWGRGDVELSNEIIGHTEVTLRGSIFSSSNFRRNRVADALRVLECLGD